MWGKVHAAADSPTLNAPLDTGHGISVCFRVTSGDPWGRSRQRGLRKNERR